MNLNGFKLFPNVITKLGLSFVITRCILFLCDGILSNTNGWLFIIVFFGSIEIFPLVLSRKDPGTLKRPLKTKETDPSQKINIGISVLMFVASFAISGLDHGFNWSRVPLIINIISYGTMISGYLFFAIVTLQNSYASGVTVYKPRRSFFINKSGRL